MRGQHESRLWVPNKDLILSTFNFLFPLGLLAPFSSREAASRGASTPSQPIPGTVIPVLSFIRAGGVSHEVHELLNDPVTAKPTGSREEHWAGAHLVPAVSAQRD